jgi:hypothetical protein
MDWNADAFFAIGKTHMVCQDYARAGRTDDGHPYAIVCDGCSSSPDTDFGARLLATSAAFQMKWICRGEGSFMVRDSQILSAAANAANEIDVEMRCLDATVVAAYRDEQDGKEGVKVSMRGDGVVVARARHPEGESFIYVVEHENNAPRYLSYELDDERLEGYLKKYGQSGRRDHVYPVAGGWATVPEELFQGHSSDQFFPAEDFDLVMVLSDGVQTFQRVARTGTSKSLEDVPVGQVVEQLLKIKGTKGKFLQRRCHKFLNTFCAINEWQHADDFSAAAIWMDGPE